MHVLTIDIPIPIHQHHITSSSIIIFTHFTSRKSVFMLLCAVAGLFSGRAPGRLDMELGSWAKTTYEK
jgi:hypothetical protein